MTNDLGPIYTKGKSYRARAEARQREYRAGTLKVGHGRYGHFLAPDAAGAGRNFILDESFTAARQREQSGKGTGFLGGRAHGPLQRHLTPTCPTKALPDVPGGCVTLGIVKRTEDEYAAGLGSEAGFIEGLMSYDDEPVVLGHYQRAFPDNRARFRWITKSRQVGYSFLMALEALARSYLHENHNAVFISYNPDEAKERVVQAKQVHEALPLAYQKRIVVDAKTELAFESNGTNKRISRIVSSPSKAPRGKKGTVYIDELAHLVNDREVYRGSTALILRSNGQLTGCSTPLGRRGIFWKIANEELRKYPHHWRQVVPWWLCRFFCTDVEAAAREAPALPADVAASRFGRPTIIEQFDSLPLGDFE